MKSIFRIGLVISLTMAVVYGCGSDEETPAGPASASAKIGPSGGVVSVAGATLTIPPGALDAETDIGIETGAPAPVGYTTFSPVFRFSPDGLVFKKPASVAIDFQGASGSPSVHWASASGPVEKLPTQIEGSRAKADVMHFSIGFVGESGATTNPDDGGTTTVDGGAPSGAVADIIHMCLVTEACGYQTIFGLPAESCAQSALDLIARGGEVHTPEHRKHFEKMIACAKGATSCDAYVKCADFDVPCTGSAQPTCNGNVAVRCSTPGANYMPRTFDCSLLGGTCVSGDCVYPAAGSCADSSTASCNGNTRVWCRPAMGGGYTTLEDPCPAGTTCFAQGDTAFCQSLKSCAAIGSSCDGETAVICTNLDGELFEARSDCSRVNRTCAVDSRGVARCVPKATECTPPAGGTSGTCNGTSVQVCIEGSLNSIDCTTLGKQSCGGSPATCQ